MLQLRIGVMMNNNTIDMDNIFSPIEKSIITATSIKIRNHMQRVAYFDLYSRMPRTQSKLPRCTIDNEYCEAGFKDE